MTSWKRIMCVAALALLPVVFRASTGAGSDEGGATTSAVTVDDTASIPDFDGGDTIGFGAFAKIAAEFDLDQGDAGYDAHFYLDDDGEIGFSDLFYIVSETVIKLRLGKSCRKS